ncbi:MAG TPA: hypothetical protein VH934_22880 [Xanthobacteraceae bacterium]|jgi:hypothetical protein
MTIFAATLARTTSGRRGREPVVASDSAWHHHRDGQGLTVKAMMGGRGDDLIDLAKTNLWR